MDDDEEVSDEDTDDGGRKPKNAFGAKPPADKSKDDSSDFDPGSEEESADEYSGSDYEPDELVKAAKRKARQKKARGKGRATRLVPRRKCVSYKSCFYLQLDVRVSSSYVFPLIIRNITITCV